MYKGNIEQNPLYIEPCVTKVFPSLPGSRQRFLIPMQIQCSYEHTFVIKSTVKYIRGGVSNSIFDYLPAVGYKLYNRRIEHTPCRNGIKNYRI